MLIGEFHINMPCFGIPAEMLKNSCNSPIPYKQTNLAERIPYRLRWCYSFRRKATHMRIKRTAPIGVER